MCNRVGTHILNIQTVHLATARTILLVFRTKPITSLFREFGFLPAEIALDNIAQKAAFRTRQLDPHQYLRLHEEKSLSQPALSRSSREIIESSQDSLYHIGGSLGIIDIRITSFSKFLSTVPRKRLSNILGWVKTT